MVSQPWAWRAAADQREWLERDENGQLCFQPLRQKFFERANQGLFSSSSGGMTFQERRVSSYLRPFLLICRWYIRSFPEWCCFCLASWNAFSGGKLLSWKRLTWPGSGRAKLSLNLLCLLGGIPIFRQHTLYCGGEVHLSQWEMDLWLHDIHHALQGWLQA